MIRPRQWGTAMAVLAIAATPVLLPGASSEAHAATSGAQCTLGTVAFSPNTPAALAVLQSADAWTHSTGAGVLVAVVDSGIDASNAHLKGVVIGGVNLVGDGENSQGLSDADGHGTAIAGEIAARLVPGSGVVGLAPEAKLLSVRVFRGTNDENVKAGFGPSADRLAEGIRYAADHGATIINAS
ncbi:MAG: S8 family serine peptidase, partial [Lacisediminihabitans sp.]